MFWPGWTAAGFRIDASRWQEYSKANVNFVRLIVHPIPLLKTEGATRKKLEDDLAKLVMDFKNKHYNVIIAIAPTESDSKVNLKDLIINDHEIQNKYLEIVSELSRTIVEFGLEDSTAVEPLNEPMRDCGATAYERWKVVQKKFLNAVRLASPSMAFVVVGDCFGSVKGLLDIRPEEFSGYNNIYYDVHYYEPHLFTMQGEPWRKDDLAYLSQVPFPTTAGRMSAVRRQMKILVDRSNMDQAKMDTVMSELNSRLDEYIKNPWNEHKIDSQADMISKWAKEHRVSTSHVIVGEFGVFRPNPGMPGADASSVNRWIGAVQRAFSKLGFPIARYADSGGFRSESAP